MPRALRPLTAGLALALVGVGAAVVGFPLRDNLWSYAFATEAGAIVMIGAATVALLVWPRGWRQAPTAAAKLGIVLASVLSIALCLWLPIGAARVHCGILTVIWLCSAASIWTRAVGPAVAALAFAALGLAAVLPELPVYARWGDSDIFVYDSSRQRPIIGPGGRLRPAQSAYMATDARPGRGVLLRTDRLGFRNDGELPGSRPADEYRVLSLGDSFSAGYGIDQDRFFGALLQERLRMGGRNARVLNAEVSDPAHGLYYLQQYGVGFLPDLVLYGMCSNDLTQTFVATVPGGLFELDSNGSLQLSTEVTSDWARKWFTVWKAHANPRPGRPALLVRQWFPDLRGLRSVERLRRWLIGFEAGRLQRGEWTVWLDEFERIDGRKRYFDAWLNLGFLYREPLEPAERMYAHFFAVLDAMRQTANRHGAEFLLVLFPPRVQVQAQDWREIVELWNLDERDFDLDRIHRRIAEHCREHGIACLDLAPAFRRAAAQENLYLPYDQHFGENGHRLAAEETAKAVLDQPAN